MHLLYLDDSGAVKNPGDEYFVLAAVAIFETHVYWLSNALDDLAKRVRPESPHDLEFCGVNMYSGRKWWRRVPRDKRHKFLREALDVIVDTRRAVRLFGAAIHKASASPDDPVEYAFEELCSRFDKFLMRLYRDSHRQRGLIVLDESSYEISLQSLARDFRTIGHRWGTTHNLCDVPLFVNSKATRLIQAADLIAYAVGRKYKHGDDQFFGRIAARFDSQGGVTHGFVHRRDEI